MNILDYNVRDIINKTQTLAMKHASGPNTDNALVTCDLDGSTCSIIVGYGDDWVVWRAPVGAVDGILSTIIGTGVAARTAAVFGSGALCTYKVKLFVDENDTATDVRATRVTFQDRDVHLPRSRIGQPLFKLGYVRWGGSSSTSTACHSASETSGSAHHTRLGKGYSRQQHRRQDRVVLHVDTPGGSK